MNFHTDKNPSRLFLLGVPAALLLVATLIIWLTGADLRLAGAVYGQGPGWPGIKKFPWDMIYAYAAVPAFIVAGAGAVVLLGGFFAARLARHRKPALFLLLLLVLGPGLLVNSLLKNNLGRARPIDVHQFGGDFPFTQIWQYGISRENRSFPSGHASVAYYLIAPWFILRRRSRLRASFWLTGGLGYGSLVGVARILQGAHFLSDVLWAGGLVYLSGELLAQALGLDREGKPAADNPKRG